MFVHNLINVEAVMSVSRSAPGNEDNIRYVLASVPVLHPSFCRLLTQFFFRGTKKLKLQSCYHSMQSFLQYLLCTSEVYILYFEQTAIISMIYFTALGWVLHGTGIALYTLRDILSDLPADQIRPVQLQFAGAFIACLSWVSETP